MFKFAADRIPVTVILLLTLLDFVVFFITENIWIFAVYLLIMIIPKACISAWNHHHQHAQVFKQKALNRILEIFYALHTGITTNLWVLHHNIGHHKNFLDQEKDESRWKRKDGSTMNRWEYTFLVAITAYPRGFKVGKKFPKMQKDFVTFTGITLLVLIGLTIYNPLSALFVFILPMVISLSYTALATYKHHAGLDTTDQFAASYNDTSKLYNWLTGNLGYHTAHHYKHGIHWSKLPELHEQIKSKIPEYCYEKPLWKKWRQSKS
ncbi:MAG: fatty acid desaturase [Cocleimonas sp.]